MSKMPIGVFVAELAAALNRGDGYIMGSKGQNPRTGQMDLSSTSVKSSWKENGYYYTQYKDAQRTQALKWRKKCTRVWDCNGMAEGIYELWCGKNIDSKARYNYAQWCDPKGSGMIPAQYRVPGAAVFWSNAPKDKPASSNIHHVAYLWKPVVEGKPEGDWYLIEAQGVMKGVVKSKLNSRKPNFWGLMTKYYDYGNTIQVTKPNTPAVSVVAVVPKEKHLGDRILKNGSEGNDVKELQTNLIRLGYDLGKWGADGDFGDCTEAAVKAFQKACGLKVTGVFTKDDLPALEKMLTAEETPVENPKKVAIKGGQCYIRAKSDTSGSILGVAKEGSEYKYAGEQSQTGWLKIEFNGGTGWVSGKYGKLVG